MFAQVLKHTTQRERTVHSFHTHNPKRVLFFSPINPVQVQIQTSTIPNRARKQAKSQRHFLEFKSTDFRVRNQNPEIQRLCPKLESENQNQTYKPVSRRQRSGRVIKNQEINQERIARWRVFWTAKQTRQSGREAKLEQGLCRQVNRCK